MTYTPNPTWVDLPSTATPVTAAALNHIEAGIAAAGALIPTAVQTATYTAASGQLVQANATTASLTVTLPAATAGLRVGVTKVNADTSVNTVTIAAAGTDTISGTTVLRLPGETRTYTALAGGWVMDGGATTLASTDARYGAVTTPEAFGAVGDGTTDDTAAINAAIAAAQAGGGKVLLSAKTYLCLGAITPVYTGPSSAPVQKPVRITSNGAATNNGYWSASPLNGGAVLDLRYTGADGLHPAKIDTRGAGTLEIDHITLVSGGTDNFPFLRTSNTTCFLNDNAVIGNLANTGSACVQDTFIFGGTSTATVSNGPDAPFQGYNSHVRNNYFSHIRRGFVGQNYCNSVPVEDNTFSTTCGNSAGGAIEFRGSSVAGYTVGNLTRGNTIEVVNYLYAIAAYWASSCTFGPDGYWDGANAYAAGVFIDPSAQYNTVVGGYHTATQPLCLDPGRTTNVTTPAQSVASFHRQPEIFTGPLLNQSIGGNGPIAMDYQGYQSLVNVARNAFPYPEGQIFTAPPVQVTDVVTTSGSAVITSATAAWTAQDVGMPLAGPGIPVGATILSRQSATQVTLTANTTATATAVTAYFGRLGKAVTQEVGFNRRHIQSQGNAPAVNISPGPAAGAGSTVTVSGTDTAYTLTLTTGTGTTAGRQCSIGAAINWGSQPRVVMTPHNAATAAAASNVWMETNTANSFINAVAPLAASTVYVWDVVAIA